MFLVVLSVFVIPTIWRLGKGFRFWFGLSAATFLAGAIGGEMLSAQRYVLVGQEMDFTYRLISTGEETLEILGLILLAYTLLLLLQSRYGGFALRIPSQSD